MPTPEQAMATVEQGLRFYAEAGITTAQDCATFKGTWQLLGARAAQGRLPIDLIAWPRFNAIDAAAFEAILAKRGATGRFRLGGVKLGLDGSIQGYMAFPSAPYFVPPGAVTPVPDKCDTERGESLFVSAANRSLTTPAAPATSGEAFRGCGAMTPGRDRALGPALRRERAPDPGAHQRRCCNRLASRGRGESACE
jgi:hypothetical protein